MFFIYRKNDHWQDKDGDWRDEEGFYDAVENLDDDARDDEYAKQEEHGEDYMPPQKGW